MPMPEELVGSPIAKAIKDRYNLDDLIIDGSTRMFTQIMPDITKTDEVKHFGLFMKPYTTKHERNFWHLMVQWRKDGKAWHALVPVEVGMHRVTIDGIRAFFENGECTDGYEWDIENEPTINNICKVIEESLGVGT